MNATTITRVEAEAWEDLAHILDLTMGTCAFIVGRLDETGFVVSSEWKFA